VEAARVAFSGDDALLIEPDAEAASRWLGDFGAGHPLIAINARDSSSYGRKYPKPDLEFWIALLRGLAALPSSPHFLFLPVSYDPADDDRRPARSLAGALLDAGVPTSRLLVLEEPLDAPVLRGLAARATLGIGISYHFLLFCLAAGVPAFGLWQNPYYRAKIEGLMSLYQCSKQALGLSSISPEAMLADVEQMLADPSLQVNRLRSLGRELEASAQKTRARILDHLPLSPEPPQSCP
jgi:polysaccharide pyruvyl transferase WcaK-like protein